MAPQDDQHDPNPFVAFRRFTDAQFASMFDSLSEPFRRQPHDDQQWSQAQDELWRRFERSYERATNPTRTQTERDAPQSRSREGRGETVPGFGRELEDPMVQDVYSPQNVSRGQAEQNPSIFGRLLGALGKTSSEEESARNVGNYWKQQFDHEQARAEEIGRSMDRCPGVQQMYADEERAAEVERVAQKCPGVAELVAERQEEQARTEAIGRAMDRCPGVQEMYAEEERAAEVGRVAQKCPGVAELLAERQEEQARSEAIERAMDRCPGVQEMYADQEAAEEISQAMDRCPGVQEMYRDEERAAKQARFEERDTPYGMSWSWGPWGVEMGSRRSRREASDDKDEADLRVEHHTFGPWAFGPFHIGPMSVSAQFPKDMEGEQQKVFDELEKHLPQLKGLINDARKASVDHMSRSKTADNEDRYAPVELMKRDGFRGHRNWRQAFEDLMAAQSGEHMLGGTPWSSSEQESDDSWRARLQDRGLYDPEDAWHRAMIGMRSQQQAPQTSQDAPHTELELYDGIGGRALAEEMAPRRTLVNTSTTTESTTDAEGFTTTKRVVVRTFSDGRTAKEESITSTPPTPQPTRRRLGEEGTKPSMAMQLKEEKQKQGSWFWS